jgi:hypothetical protein
MSDDSSTETSSRNNRCPIQDPRALYSGLCGAFNSILFWEGRSDSYWTEHRSFGGGLFLRISERFDRDFRIRLSLVTN